MQLAVQDFTALVRVQAAAVTRAARVLMDLSVGSVLRAVLEANASVALWVQWLVMEVLAMTRAATSAGTDLDSWVGDFGVARLPAVAAHGEVQFSRGVAGFSTVVPVGALVRTGTAADAQAFVVVADPTRPGWMGGGYALGADALSVSAPVRAAVAGRAGNVAADTLRLLSTPIPGVDAVTNAAAARGGLEAEEDAALRARFAGFIDSRTRATVQAVQFAAAGVQQGLQLLIAERVDPAGGVRNGHFTVVVDDGSGAPDAALIERVALAIEGVRPVGGTYSVVAPTGVAASVSMRVAAPADALAAVQARVAALVAGLGIGEALVLSRIVQAAHDADARVARVGDVLVNGAAADLQAPLLGRVRLASVSVLQ